MLIIKIFHMFSARLLRNVVEIIICSCLISLLLRNKISFLLHYKLVVVCCAYVHHETQQLYTFGLLRYVMVGF